MKKTKTAELYKKYELTNDDVFQHKHYLIITRSGIDKIQAKEKIFISYEAVKVEPEFCVVKAVAKKDDASIETFGSSKYGSKTWNTEKKKWDEFGNTTTWYVMEMAEKRAMSRAVLKLTGFYELGVFGEDESEDFKRQETSEKPKSLENYPNHSTQTEPIKIDRIKARLESCTELEGLATVYNSLTSLEKKASIAIKDAMKEKLTKKSA